MRVRSLSASRPPNGRPPPRTAPTPSSPVLWPRGNAALPPSLPRPLPRGDSRTQHQSAQSPQSPGQSRRTPKQVPKASRPTTAKSPTHPRAPRPDHTQAAQRTMDAQRADPRLRSPDVRSELPRDGARDARPPVMNGYPRKEAVRRPASLARPPPRPTPARSHSGPRSHARTVSPTRLPRTLNSRSNGSLDGSRADAPPRVPASADRGDRGASPESRRTLRSSREEPAVNLEELERENVVEHFFCRGHNPMEQGLRMDVAHYWEKRRLQNSLRRVLEALQEHCNFEGDNPREFGAAFDSLCEHFSAGVTHFEGDTLDEQQFISALDAFGLWPWEVSPCDQREVFSCLCVPSLRAARGVLGGQPLRTCLDRGVFVEGFSKVPFNLPDFPVPTHLMPQALNKLRDDFSVEQTKELAEVVVLTFCMQRTGLDHTKDFFLCGLLSLEEIQMALPRLTPVSFVGVAVEWIIRTGAPYLSQDEWRRFVFDLRGDLPVEGEGRAGFGKVGSGAGRTENSCTSDPGEMATSPLESPESRTWVVDWGTVTQAALDRSEASTSSISIHQADEGAGAAGACVNVMAGAPRDPVSMLSLSLHSECGGPFLAHAFMRCCQLCRKRAMRPEGS